MMAFLQGVTSAKVEVGKQEVGSKDAGVLVFVGVERTIHGIRPIACWKKC